MLWTVSPRDGSRCRHFSSCRSISQSEDEDEAQHCNCTMPQMQKSLINFKPLQDPAAKFNASLDYLPAHQERVRWKGHSHRFTGCTSATFFLAFTGTTQQSNESWQSMFCVFALDNFVGSIMSTSGDPSLTFAHLCHGALWSCIWPRWCWNMMKKAETLRQTHTTWIGYTVY